MKFQYLRNTIYWKKLPHLRPVSATNVVDSISEDKEEETLEMELPLSIPVEKKKERVENKCEILKFLNQI